MIYDIFYVSSGKILDQQFEKIRSRFPTVQKIENATSFDDAKSKSLTKFFWIVWDDILVDEKFDFAYRVTKWDQEYVHVFKNNCNGVESYFNGICLVPKNVSVTQKEFKHRFFVNKKEIDIVASKSQYPIISINSYEEYTNVIENIHIDLFWYVPSDVEIIDRSVFDLYFDPKDGQYDHDRNENHVFKNGEYYDGVMLLSKNKRLTKKEFDKRFPVGRKEWNRLVSNPRPFDIVFISYDEPNADENYIMLKSRFPRAKRIHGIKGIHQAHIEAAKISQTDRFWVVDGDAKVVDDFDFTTEQIAYYDQYNRQAVSVWLSQNPINDLVYGYGGVKLLPKNKTIKMDIEAVDMTTSISDNFKVVSKVSNYTNFNTDSFSTWKSAFRECVKLSSKAIDKNYQEETEERLKIWCTVGRDRPFGEYALLGANAGKEYGLLHIGNKVALSMINDFDWLIKKFEKNKNRLSDG